MSIFRVQDQLSFSKIAEHWSREHSPTVTIPELRHAMFCAWWRGELRGDGPPGRLRALRLLFSRAQNRITFIGPGLPPSPNGWVDTDDGGAVVTSSPEVRLPGAVPEEWTEESCEVAFRAVADQWEEINIESDDILGPIFDVVSTTSEEFFVWLKRVGASAPKFWEQPPAPSAKQRREGKSAATVQCAEWLNGEMQRGPQVGPKPAYLDVAQDYWGERLSSRQFNQAWRMARTSTDVDVITGWPSGGVPRRGWPGGEINRPSARRGQR